MGHRLAVVREYLGINASWSSTIVDAGGPRVLARLHHVVVRWHRARLLHLRHHVRIHREISGLLALYQMLVEVLTGIHHWMAALHLTLVLLWL